MKQTLFTLLFAFALLTAKAQSFQFTDTIKAPANLDNIYSRPLYSDSLASSFVIFIKKEVKPHKHVFHSEHIYVLEGEGEMEVGDKKFRIQKGDIVFIHKNTRHTLRTTSQLPVKVISIQAPLFDGKDRIFVE